MPGQRKPKTTDVNTEKTTLSTDSVNISADTVSLESKTTVDEKKVQVKLIRDADVNERPRKKGDIVTVTERQYERMKALGTAV